MLFFVLKVCLHCKVFLSTALRSHQNSETGGPSRDFVKKRATKSNGQIYLLFLFFLVFFLDLTKVHFGNYFFLGFSSKSKTIEQKQRS